MKKISIIIPCFNEQEAIPLFYEEINKITKQIKYQFEFIFINDGSTDNTINIIKIYRINCSNCYPHIKSV